MNDEKRAACDALYEKVITVVLEDEGANDPAVALSALSQALVDTAKAAGIGPPGVIQTMVEMMGGRSVEVPTVDIDRNAVVVDIDIDRDVVVVGKPHDC